MIDGAFGEGGDGRGGGGDESPREEEEVEEKMFVCWYLVYIAMIFTYTVCVKSHKKVKEEVLNVQFGKNFEPCLTVRSVRI